MVSAYVLKETQNQIGVNFGMCEQAMWIQLDFEFLHGSLPQCQKRSKQHKVIWNLWSSPALPMPSTRPLRALQIMRCLHDLNFSPADLTVSHSQSCKHSAACQCLILVNALLQPPHVKLGFTKTPAACSCKPGS